MGPQFHYGEIYPVITFYLLTGGFKETKKVVFLWLCLAMFGDLLLGKKKT
jgi:hypothetical protein